MSPQSNMAEKYTEFNMYCKELSKITFVINSKIKMLYMLLNNCFPITIHIIQEHNELLLVSILPQSQMTKKLKLLKYLPWVS